MFVYMKLLSIRLLTLSKRKGKIQSLNNRCQTILGYPTDITLEGLLVLKRNGDIRKSSHSSYLLEESFFPVV